MPRKEVEEYLYPMNLRVERKLYDAIEFEWRDQQYRTRTAFLVDALETFIHGSRCPYCGAFNTHGARICSVCMRPLDETDSLVVKVNIERKIRNPKLDEVEKITPKKGWNK